MSSIALLTDFGLRDHYVGVLHAVLDREAPGIPRIDLCHEVPPGDTATAAFFLRESWRWLEEETVVLVIVDPGVGSSRRAVVARVGERFIIAPDNGILCSAGRPDEAREIAVEGEISSTFHGRDLFAPAAARLALELSLENFGARVDPTTLQTSPLPEARKIPGGYSGKVIHVDRFGNLITNIPFSERMRRVSWEGGETSTGIRFYDEAPPGRVCFLSSSSAFVELAMRRESAADASGLRRGDVVIVHEFSEGN